MKRYGVGLPSFYSSPCGVKGKDQKGCPHLGSSMYQQGEGGISWEMLVWEEALATSQLCSDAEASPTHKRRRGEGITCLQGRDVLIDAVRSRGQEFIEV